MGGHFKERTDGWLFVVFPHEAMELNAWTL